MARTLFSIALLLAATRAGGLLSRRFHMPDVLGSMLAGVLLGPALLHLVPYDNNIRLLSNLGVILLMFLAGLETDVSLFKKTWRSALAIALTGVLLPLVLGTLGASLFYHNLFENLFLGVILTATSVSITVETLTELGKLNSRVGMNILGAAVADDVLGLVLISLLLAAKNSSGTSLAATGIGLAVFCMASALALALLPQWSGPLLKKVQPGRSLLVFALAGAFLAAFFAEQAGIAAITGAYLFGLLASQFPQRDYLQRNVRVLSSGFLSPIFFASVGLQAAVGGFGLRQLLITLVMFVIAVAGKVIGCGTAARAFHMSRREALQTGAGMVSRGEVALITANIGLSNGIITQEVFVPTILVVLLTTILTPVLLKFVFSHKAGAHLET